MLMYLQYKIYLLSRLFALGVISGQEVHNVYPDWDNIYIRKLDPLRPKPSFNPMERFNEKLKQLETDDSNSIHYMVGEPPKKADSNENLLQNLHKKINNLEQQVDEHNRRTKLNEENIKKLHERKDTTVWDDTKSLVNDYIVEPVEKWHDQTGKQLIDSSKKAIVEKVWDPISSFFRNL